MSEQLRKLVGSKREHAPWKEIKFRRSLLCEKTIARKYRTLLDMIGPSLLWSSCFFFFFIFFFIFLFFSSSSSSGGGGGGGKNSNSRCSFHNTIYDVLKARGFRETEVWPWTLELSHTGGLARASQKKKVAVHEVVFRFFVEGLEILSG